MTPAETLAAAQNLLDRDDARTASVWPRAAALLGRQALEQGLDAYWRAKRLPLDQFATRPQLICLGRYLTTSDLAARANHAWSALSRACHRHPYELPPSQVELRHWLTTVGDVLEAMRP